MKGFLVLEDGTTLIGKAFGAPATVYGEMFFHTDMAGYEKLLTDGSNAGQIVLMNYPLIGNYGFSERDKGVHMPKALIVKDFSVDPSHFECTKTLSEFLVENNIFGLAHVDTRMLTRKIRTAGSLKCMLTTDNDFDVNKEILNIKRVSGHVSIPEPPYRHIQGDGESVGVLDLGAAEPLLTQLSADGYDVHVFSSVTSSEEILQKNVKKVYLSHGSADPKQFSQTTKTLRGLMGHVEISGHGLGMLVLARAYGMDTCKMKNGHRGANYPVLAVETNKVEMTKQNIGYCLVNETITKEVTITHTNVNDSVVEGYRVDGNTGISH